MAVASRRNRRTVRSFGNESVSYAHEQKKANSAEMILGKIRGLTVMLLGAVAIGYGTGNLPISIVAVFSGLAMLLFGFTWLMA